MAIAPGLIVGIPSRGVVPIDWMMHMHDVFMRVPNGMKWCPYYTRGIPVAEARQSIVDYVLKVKAKYLLFLDDDSYPADPDVILRLFNANKDVISGVVYTKSDPSMPCVFEKDGAGPWLDWHKRPPGVYPVEATGLAFTLIKREVLEKIKAPHFVWRSETESDGATVRFGEDTYFFQRVREAGFQPYIDTSVFCVHGEHTFSDSGVKIKFYPTTEQAMEYFQSQESARRSIV